MNYIHNSSFVVGPGQNRFVRFNGITPPTSVILLSVTKLAGIEPAVPAAAGVVFDGEANFDNPLGRIIADVESTADYFEVGDVIRSWIPDDENGTSSNRVELSRVAEIAGDSIYFDDTFEGLSVLRLGTGDGAGRKFMLADRGGPLASLVFRHKSGRVDDMGESAENYLSSTPMNQPPDYEDEPTRFLRLEPDGNPSRRVTLDGVREVLSRAYRYATHISFTQYPHALNRMQPIAGLPIGGRRTTYFDLRLQSKLADSDDNLALCPADNPVVLWYIGLSEAAAARGEQYRFEISSAIPVEVK